VSRRRWLLVSMLVVALAAPAIAQTKARGRLFPPQDLGLLEGADRELWQKPEQIMDALGIADGAVVADLGAGGGWFTIRLARRVGPNGLVYAEDIQPEMIEAVARRVEREGLRNVRTVLGTAKDPRLPRGIDAVLIVDAYHEMEDPADPGAVVLLLKNVARSLKSQGRIGIIDFNPGGGGPGPAPADRVAPETVITAASDAGLQLISREAVGPFQFLLVFGKGPMRTALTIGGSDSSGGAGIQADLKTFAAFGVYGVSAVTAITAQSTVDVAAVSAISADLVVAQMEAVAGDLGVHAVKTGMLANAAIVEAVAAAIAELDLPMLVVDPVMISTSGAALLDADGVAALRAELLPRARVITPNIPEAEALTGRRIESPSDARDAARRLHEMGAGAVIITGGHASGADVVDLLFDGDSFAEFHTPRIDAANAHGTGCTFAAAVAAQLALGHPVADAAERAQQYVAGALRHALPVGHGALDHFWQLNDQITR
jgi:hydroxymethylpyrimidine/phosphomethylpyrimidine kinase